MHGSLSNGDGRWQDDRVIRTLRETLRHEGLTHAEAAHALNCTRGSIARWLDMDPMELPGRVALWCAGLLRVDWPEDFKPQLVAVEVAADDSDEQVQRRLFIANRLVDRLQKALLTMHTLQDAAGVVASEAPSQLHGWKPGLQEDDGEILTGELLGVTKLDMSELAELTGTDQVKPTSVALSQNDIDTLGKLARHLGRSRSDVMRMLLRRYAPTLLQAPGIS